MGILVKMFQQGIFSLENSGFSVPAGNIFGIGFHVAIF